MASVPAETVQAAIDKYNELIQEQQQLAQKISEFEMDCNEHKLVEETLAPLDPNRRAYRLVGEVLVERTVEEVLPSVKKNRENVSSSLVSSIVCRLVYRSCRSTVPCHSLLAHSILFSLSDRGYGFKPETEASGDGEGVHRN